MPPKQLKQVLNANWPDGWLKEFKHFDVRPIAAASIGQVHRAELRDGRDVAIKVQYPGVKASIDSDVSNVGALVRMAGVLPKGFDMTPYLDEARRQLHEETDYLREAAQLSRFGDWLAGDARYSVPSCHADWSTSEILTMEFLPGQPIEEVQGLDGATRARVTENLIDLTLRELFEFGTIQSDPNFANFHYDAATGKIVLLDFGATRELDPDLVAHCREILRAGLTDDHDALRQGLDALGVLTGMPAFDEAVLRMVGMVFDAARNSDPLDFANSDLLALLNVEGHKIAELDFVPPAVPMDALYLQRKLGGMFLLATRLGGRARVLYLLERALMLTATLKA